MCFFLHEAARYDHKPFVGSILPYRCFAGKLMPSTRPARADCGRRDVVETGRSKIPGARRRSEVGQAKALSVSLTTRRLSFIIVRAGSQIFDRLPAFQQFGHIATPVI